MIHLFYRMLSLEMQMHSVGGKVSLILIFAAAETEPLLLE